MDPSREKLFMKPGGDEPSHFTERAESPRPRGGKDTYIGVRRAVTEVIYLKLRLEL